jgi:hypothetical protein
MGGYITLYLIQEAVLLLQGEVAEVMLGSGVQILAEAVAALEAIQEKVVTSMPQV